MANMKELLPEGDYVVKVVGPSREWEFTGNNGAVKMATDSIQFEGHEEYWVDVNRAQDKPAPEVGATLKGHIEQDEAGKYPPKFVKQKGGGGGWSGGSAKASPGAIQAQNVSTAVTIVNGFYSLMGKKPKDFDAYMAKIEAVAPNVGAMVDRLVGKATPKADDKPATNSEAGESPAPAAAPASKKADDTVVVDDLTDEDLGEW